MLRFQLLLQQVAKGRDDAEFPLHPGVLSSLEAGEQEEKAHRTGNGALHDLKAAPLPRTCFLGTTIDWLRKGHVRV